MQSIRTTQGFKLLLRAVELLGCDVSRSACKDNLQQAVELVILFDNNAIAGSTHEGQASVIHQIYREYTQRTYARGMNTRCRKASNLEASVDSCHDYKRTTNRRTVGV